jgi:hypothetical protein
MAKALLGSYVRHDDRLVLEAARLRHRVQDLQALVNSLEDRNRELQAELDTRRMTDEMAISLRESPLGGALDASLGAADLSAAERTAVRELVDADTSR